MQGQLIKTILTSAIDGGHTISYSKSSKFILLIGLRRSQLDHCMYIGVIESHTVLMAVFVDDILLVSTCEDVTVHVKSLFHAQFRIKDMGPASEFLNIRITQRPGVISIDQEPYVNSILAKYPIYVYWYT